jgi:hypothetical protein
LFAAMKPVFLASIPSGPEPDDFAHRVETRDHVLKHLETRHGQEQLEPAVRRPDEIFRSDRYQNTRR